jgi:hypothetical protein
MWGLQPSEFWRLQPCEFWWILEAKNPEPPNKWASLYELIK